MNWKLLEMCINFLDFKKSKMEENNANKQNLRDAKRDKSKDSCNAKTCDGVTDQSRKSIDSKKDFLTPQDLQQVAADCIVPKAEDIESASIKVRQLKTFLIKYLNDKNIYN